MHFHFRTSHQWCEWRSPFCSGICKVWDMGICISSIHAPTSSSSLPLCRKLNQSRGIFHPVSPAFCQRRKRKLFFCAVPHGERERSQTNWTVIAPDHTSSSHTNKSRTFPFRTVLWCLVLLYEPREKRSPNDVKDGINAAVEAAIV
jgi:hypothetical protein